MGDSPLQMKRKPLHIAVYPWFAMGHFTPYLHISSKLADRGHKISFFIPPKAELKLKPFNRHPTLITFFPIPVPTVTGLPAGAETTADVPFSLIPLIATAMDLTRPAIEASLRALRPDLVFFDFTHWMPEVCRDLGIKSALYWIISPATLAYTLSRERKMFDDVALRAADLMRPPPGFPPPAIRFSKFETLRMAAMGLKEFGASGLSFSQRHSASLAYCDAIGFKSCEEMDGAYCDYLSEQYQRPVILAGPVVPRPPESPLEEKWAGFLNKFDPGTVIFCALGSECALELEQFHELVLGLELTGMPFLAALKPPVGVDSIELSLPEGFKERVEGKGVVDGGWVQQPQVLQHPAVGCFVMHCGSGSMMEGMASECQLVLLPTMNGDQFMNARRMGMGCLKVGVEVERGEEDGRFQRRGVAEAVQQVMEKGGVVGEEARRNHKKWREFLLGEGLDRRYVDRFVEGLYGLLGNI